MCKPTEKSSRVLPVDYTGTFNLQYFVLRNEYFMKWHFCHLIITPLCMICNSILYFVYSTAWESQTKAGKSKCDELKDKYTDKFKELRVRLSLYFYSCVIVYDKYNNHQQ